MATREGIMEGEKRIRPSIGDYKCPVCGTKVVNGEHMELAIIAKRLIFSAGRQER